MMWRMQHNGRWSVWTHRPSPEEAQVSIIASDQEITTQQAAELLGVSRPTVVRLVDDGELPARVPGTVRRRLRLADVLNYRESLRNRRNRFISESSAEYPQDDAEDIDVLLKDARRAR